jgi:hypothetical protein
VVEHSHGGDAEDVMAASEKSPVGQRPPSLSSCVRTDGPAILIGKADECVAAAELQPRPSPIGRRLPGNSEYSIITNYVSTRAERCKGVVGVENPVGIREEARLASGVGTQTRLTVNA